MSFASSLPARFTVPGIDVRLHGTSALSNVCRSLLGVDQEQDDPAQRSQKLDASTREEANGAGWQGVDLDTSRQRSADVGRGARERLLQEMEARTGVAALCGLLARTKVAPPLSSLPCFASLSCFACRVRGSE